MLLQTRGLSKAFHGTYALRDVDLSLDRGQVLGLVGENGAGKSTLIKLLTGVYRLEEGQLLWEDSPVSVTSPLQAQHLGIRAVHQDRALIPSFTGVENIFLGTSYPTHRGLVDWKAMTRTAQEIADRLGMELDLSRTAAELSPPQRTELEIIRAVLSDCKLLILDEPTAALTDREAERLFSVIRTLKETGTAILYVSHRLEEILTLTDRVIVLRNGREVSTWETAQVTREQLIAAMSDSLEAHTSHRPRSFGPALLKAEHISSRDGAVKDGEITAHAGEIVGLFGLGGSGRTELLECLYGTRPCSGGAVILDGKPQRTPSPVASLKQGVALVPEDRRGKALISGLGLSDNILLSCLDRSAHLGVRNRRKERDTAKAQVDALQIRSAALDQPISELSGGNQQKAVFARVLLTQPRVLLCDEPTQAVDVTTRAQLHRLLREKADQGCAVVYVSSDLNEVLEVADTVQVMVQGRTLPPMANEGLTSRQLLALCYQS